MVVSDSNHDYEHTFPEAPAAGEGRQTEPILWDAKKFAE